MNYIVAGPTIVNDLHLHNGVIIPKVLGGSVYCVSGLKLWAQTITYVSKVGPDFPGYFGSWMKANAVSSEGVMIDLPHTHYSILSYNEGGHYTETSFFDQEYEEMVYAISRLHGRDIAKHCSKTTSGIYLECYESEGLWDELHLIRASTDAPIMWEVPEDSLLTQSRRTKTVERIGMTDAFSVNIPEGKILFQTTSFDSLISRIQSLHVPCFLRAGVTGSYWIGREGVFFSPSIALGDPVDPTGCGNASTAAALCGYAEGYPPPEIPMLANISAAFTVLQYGPYPAISNRERKMASDILISYRKRDHK